MVAKLKILVRGLPWTTTEEEFVAAVQQATEGLGGPSAQPVAAATKPTGSSRKGRGGSGAVPAALSSSAASSEPTAPFQLLQFKKGKAPRKYKNAGALPAWATLGTASAEIRDVIAAKFDGKPFVEGELSDQMVQVEFCPLQRTSFVEVPRGKITDSLAGQIYEDPQFLAFCEDLERNKSEPMSSDLSGLQRWMEEQKAREERQGNLSEGGGDVSALVKSLQGKWYYGKKLPWEIRADEQNEKEGGKKKSRRDRKREKLEKKRGKKGERKVLVNRESELLRDINEEERKKEKKKLKKLAKERKVKDREAKQRRLEREGRKREVIKSKKGAKGDAPDTAAAASPATEKKNTFSVSKASGGAPKHKDPTPAAPAKPQIKIMKRAPKAPDS